jgi:hypothetical protein
MEPWIDIGWHGRAKENTTCSGMIELLPGAAGLRMEPRNRRRADFAEFW